MINFVTNKRSQLLLIPIDHLFLQEVYLFRDIKILLYPQEEDNYILSALQFLTG